MGHEQIDLFEGILPTFKFTKRIRLIEMFGGIGSQASALERLHADFEHYRLIEFDKYPVASYNAVHGTHFEPIDIRDVHAEDLGIVERERYQYLCTYSFPCQDISLAGKGAGFSKGSGTRSGLLWEVERILNECGGDLPDCLVMENVSQIVNEKNIGDFKEWMSFLESKGYKNYVELLNAKDFGIPQNRLRCFMVSVLGDFFYQFPRKQGLTLKLSDLLEKDVDDKYFMSDEDIAKFTNKRLSETLACNEVEDGSFIDAYNNATRSDGIAGTIRARVSASNMHFIAVAVNNKKGYEEAEVGDSVSLERPTSKSRRGRVGKGLAKTILGHMPQGVVVEMGEPKLLGGFGKVGSTNQYFQQNRVYSDGVGISVCTRLNPFYATKLGIRKLTPRECWRLMGFTDDDFDKASKVNSDTQLYKQAGNSIVVQVLMAIFAQML